MHPATSEDSTRADLHLKESSAVPSLLDYNESVPLTYYVLPNVGVLVTRIVLRGKRSAAARAKHLGLSNFSIVHAFVENYDDRDFQIGVALHACGEATDAVLDLCLQARASVLLIPCCVGKVQLAQDHRAYPQSLLLASVLSQDAFFALAKAADVGSEDALAADPRGTLRRACKTAFDEDRLQRMRERGYVTATMRLSPASASAKNDVLIGIASALYSYLPRENLDATSVTTAIPPLAAEFSRRCKSYGQSLLATAGQR